MIVGYLHLQDKKKWHNGNAQKHKNFERIKTMYLSLLCIASLVASLFEGVSGCSVTPSAAAVVAGNNLSLTCTAQSKSESIDTWKFGGDTVGALVLYQAPIYYQDGSIKVERRVADGYSANDSNLQQVVLTIIKASTEKAEYYYCICTGSTQSSDIAYVSVLVSEPTFSNTTEITDGEPVIFTCSISFSGLANLSITIKDSFGNNINTNNYAVTSKGLHNFSLDYSTTANSSISQEYSCNITLTNDTSNTRIYSTRVNYSVQWVSVRNVQIRPIDETRCLHGKKCAINQTVRCTAEGNPKPVTFQWLNSVTGSGFTISETSGDHLTFKTVGNNTVQCIAYNEFIGTRYSSSSSIFTTQVLVVVDGPLYPKSDESPSTDTSKSAIIVGLVVGLGGSMIAITITVLTIAVVRKRKISQQTKKEIYTSLEVQGSATSGNPQQATYVELNTSTVGSQPRSEHLVAAEYYENVELDLNEQTESEMYTSLDAQRSATSGMSQQDIYTELNASPVGSEHPHRVAAENY